MCSRTTRVSDKGLIHPTPHYVRRGWVCPGRRGAPSQRTQEVLCPTACAQRNAGTDECFVTGVGGARAGLVLGRSRWMTEMARYGLAVAARFLCLLSLRRPLHVRLVVASPEPIRMQGEANAVGRQPKANLTRPITKQGKANALRKQPERRRRQKPYGSTKARGQQ
jgi:hypothetical protein